MSPKKKRIICTITSDTNYDQRMIRICTSLHNAGYDVLLVGRKRPVSKALIPRPFRQRRISQRIDKGKLFYATYNFKLLLLLLFSKADCFCAIDLDTIMPVYIASLLRGMPRVYDAHELFCEIEEVVRKPREQRIWRWIERTTMPHFKHGYTVNKSYVDEYRRLYGVDYSIVRNATVLKPLTIPPKPERTILYQGAVNHGRCFEQLIPAMQQVNAKLIICGDGNFFEETVALVKQYGLEHKVEFTGYVPPKELPAYTAAAYIGITLFVATSLSNELSLANRFFDYLHAGVPQLCVAYPEYKHISSEYEVALLLDTVTPDTIAAGLNRLLNDDAYYAHLQQECIRAREVYNWQQEESRLLGVYQSLFQAQVS